MCYTTNMVFSFTSSIVEIYDINIYAKKSSEHQDQQMFQQ